MELHTVNHCLPLLLILLAVEAKETSYNVTESVREPRGSRRVVKQYSGSRPDPIICTDEGFQADPNNCAVFYRCMKAGRGKFTSFKFQCAPGTIYDPDTEVCNHPQSTKRSGCGGEVISLKEEPHENEIDGIHQELPSPITTKNPVYAETPSKYPWVTITKRQDAASTTTTPWTTSTKKLSTRTTSMKLALEKSTKAVTLAPLSTSTRKLRSTMSVLSVTRQHNSQIGDLCTSEGFMGDSENCRKFYRCVGNQRGGFIRYEFLCSDTTIWDDDIQSCNHAWAVKRRRCGRGNSNDIIPVQKENNGGSTERPTGSKTTPTTIQEQLQINYGSPVSQSQTQIASGSVKQNQTQMTIKNSTETKPSNFKQNQTQISHGSAVSQSQTQISYNDKGVQTQLQIDHTNESSQSQTQIHEISTKRSTTTIHSDDYNTNYVNTTLQTNSDISTECTKNGFIRDRNDCKKFYRCVDNGRGSYTRYDFSCGEGTVWDSKLGACNHAWAVKDCGGESYTTVSSEKSTERPGTTTDATKSTQNIVSSTQAMETEENEDIGYGNQNQVDSVTSSTTKSTTLTSTSTSTTRHTTKKPNTSSNNTCTSSGFMGDGNDCKKFYRCVENGNGAYSRYEFSCGDGTVWDSKIEACNHAWAVENCGANSISEVEKTETTTPKDTVTTTVRSTTKSQMTSSKPVENDDYDTGYGLQDEDSSSSVVVSSTTISSVSEHTQNTNDCLSNGFIGDNSNCKKFYRCVDDGNGRFIRYEFTCGEGTVWDQKINACNHIGAVEKCGQSSTESNKEVSTNQYSTTSSSEQPTAVSNQDNDIDTGYGQQSQSPSTSSTTENVQQVNLEPDESKCKSSGFMGDKKNCKKFYRCVDNGNGSFTTYEFTCGEGTVWDPKIESCNHEWAVESCGGTFNDINKQEITTSQRPTYSSTQSTSHAGNDYETGYGEQHESTSSISTTQISEDNNNQCKSSGFMGDKNDCKKFYRCVDNGNGGFTRYEFTCGDGTVWDPKIESCNHVWAVEKCGYITQNTETAHTTEIPTSTTTKPQNHTESQPDGTTKKPISTSICTQDGFVGDTNDCKKFYRCVDNGQGGYIKYEFTCGDGTAWNQDIQACDHESPNRSCINNSLHKEPVEKEPEQQQDEMYPENTTKDSITLHESTQASQSSPSTASGICEAEGFYGNPDDCKKFYRCVDNGQGGYTKYDFNCGDGTVWDQEIQACNHESSNKCSMNFVNENTDGSSSSTTSSTTSAYTEQQHSSEVSHDSGDDKCTSEGFFANYNDCRKFHRCVSNDKGGYIKYDFACAEGTVWVQDIQSCDYEDDNTSCLRNISTSKPQPTQDQQTTEESYWQSSTVSTISPDKPDKQSDEYSDNDSSNSASESETCSSEGFYPNRKDCKKFYRCVDNGQGGYTKYEFTCGEGTAWDTDIQTCNHINEVKQCQYETQDTENKPMQDESSQTTDNTSTTTTSTTESNQPSNKNTCEEEGYFGNKQDCKKFYRCVDNGKGGYTKYDYDCGEGTIWDQDVTTCNHPQDVKNPSCQDTESSTSSPSGTSTTSHSTASSSSQTTSSGSQSSTSSTESSSQSSTNCSQENSSKKPGNEDIKCEKAGYYPNPNDCKKFYRCVDWDGDGQRFSVYHFDCGEGTIWDPQLETCNHEESVYPPRDCSGTQSQNENIQESSSTSTEDSTTTTESTTQQSTTTDQSITQQSTSSEETTTQESTTSQSTTQQSTSSEETTTQQSTTSTKTTTQQPSTEQTTTQQSTTPATTQTTTQQSTTTESSTTQQSSTTDSTTTQQTTTESTTTQQTTTTDSTTSQHTTTTEGTTTEESTTSESTTTEQSTTTQETTTQSSTTTEQTTTTTESAMTEQSTTQESTTEQTTEKTTDTDETTTQQLTTTQESTTEMSDSTTNDSSTTEESTTEQQTTTESSSDDQSITEVSTTQATDDSSTTENGEESTTETSSTSSKECPDTEDDQYLYVCPTSFKRHPKYCNMFYQCTEDDDSHELKIAVFTCPNNTIYDESKTQCVEEDKSEKKCEGEIAQKRRFKRLNRDYKEPIVVGKQKHSCSTIGYLPFEEGSECSSAFMKCQRVKSGKLRGYVHRCPEGYLYWSISKRCEKQENLKDCKRSSNDWSRRWEIPVERKNVDI